MKRAFILCYCLGLFALSGAYALDITSEAYTELDSYSLNDDSHLNPSNMHGLNSLSSYVQDKISFRTNLSDEARVKLDLECRYDPIQLNPGETVQDFKLKELSLDIPGDFFSARIGKQYLTWGSAQVFNPVDIINYSNDSIFADELEGNYSMDLLFPFQSWFSVEVLSFIPSSGVNSLGDLPLLGKLDFSAGSFSGFVFGYVKKSCLPQYGLDGIYSWAPSDGLNLSFYAEALYRGDSQVKYFPSGGGAPQSRQDGFYGAMSAGSRADYKINSSKILGGLDLLVEYYYDMENWSKEELEQYWAYLDSLKASAANHATALDYYCSYKNSPSYLYASLKLKDLVKKDLSLTTACLMNLSDYSLVLLPELSYSFNSDNTTVGLRGRWCCGSGESEYGNMDYKVMISFYLQTSF